ncbi:hypothetical protein [Burkholderia sp. Bp8963]|uniref:hypothetical protein n=1 Tax=Burkholderia sp. Bp8963 TaxID=2184547 RepID=UPI000F5AA903|nr:hypothetical protein [Burkholderia sp. Bp8963]
MALSREKARKLSDAAPVEDPDARKMSLELNDWIYKNRYFVEAQNGLLALATSEVPKLVVVFTGVRRTQKSTVVKAVRAILDDRAATVGKALGSLAIGVPPFDRNGAINWKEGGRDVLLPVIGGLADSVVPIPPLEMGALNLREVRYKRGSELAYLSAIASDMAAEAIPFFIDHAHIIHRLSSSGRVKTFFAVLARLVDKGKHPVVLVGGPGLALLCATAVDVNVEYLEMKSYLTDQDGLYEIAKLLDAFEQKVGERFCEKGLLKSHTSEIATMADARIGVMVDALKSSFEQDCVWVHGRLTWATVQLKLKAALADALEFESERVEFERHANLHFASRFNSTSQESKRSAASGESTDGQSESSGTKSDFAKASDDSNAAEPTTGDSSDEATAVPGAVETEMPKRRRGRRRRVGRTKQSNRPLHPHGEPQD